MDIRSPELRITEGMGLMEIHEVAAKMRAEATRDAFKWLFAKVTNLRLPQALRVAH